MSLPLVNGDAGHDRQHRRAGGFGIARQISVRGALEMMAAAYAFDAVESDHQLKFKKRGRAPSRGIPETTARS